MQPPDARHLVIFVLLSPLSLPPCLCLNHNSSALCCFFFFFTLLLLPHLKFFEIQAWILLGMSPRQTQTHIWISVWHIYDFFFFRLHIHCDVWYPSTPSNPSPSFALCFICSFIWTRQLLTFLKATREMEIKKRKPFNFHYEEYGWVCRDKGECCCGVVSRRRQRGVQTSVHIFINVEENNLCSEAESAVLFQSFEGSSSHFSLHSFHFSLPCTHMLQAVFPQCLFVFTYSYLQCFWISCVHQK